jgi:hypothetical protein
MYQGFLLGLSSGGVCLLYCLPVLFPFLASEGSPTRTNFRYLALFMAGRLAGYIVFACGAWAAGIMAAEAGILREAVFGAAYVVLSVLLALYAFGRHEKSCAAGRRRGFFSSIMVSNPRFAASVMGFLTGINLCPPFLLAFTGASEAGSLGGSVVFFASFFAGTALYFLHVPLMGRFRSDKLRMLGVMSALVVAAYYFIRGIIMFSGVVLL